MITMPQDVCEIIDTIENAGYEAYAVGGCIRDSILFREPKDWDITTSAKPDEVKALFKRTIDTGIQHGTVTIILGNCGYEVTTYRIDGEYLDGRHPKEVVFSASLAEDLRRRDFTMNALAYHPKRGLVDLFDGIGDMQKGVIRCVGVANERFSEDALRIMRAIRFAGELGYEIEEQTRAAMTLLAENLQKISAERIQVELNKLLISAHPELIRTAYETGILKVILPHLDTAFHTTQNNPHHCYTVGEHSLKATIHVRADKVLRLAALFHDIGKICTKTKDENGIDHFHGHAAVSRKMTKEILKQLKYDNDTTNSVLTLIEYHDYELSLKPEGMRKDISKIGSAYFPMLFELKEADVYGQSDYQREQKLDKLAKAKALYQEIMEKGEPLTIKELDVTGYDLIEMGIPKGKELGAKLQYLLDCVLENPDLNHKDILLELASKA